MNDHPPFGDPGSGLLPAGLVDALPPDASREAALVTSLLAGFAAHGYELIKPPLVEFEETLLSGTGATMRPHCFRLMDPVSQRMMGVRPDITPQAARIARTRLGRAARPLRLCYAGEVLRVRGSQLRPARQFAQVGAELIGAASAAADAEVVVLAAAALAEIGIDGLSADLAIPTLVPALAEAQGLDPARLGPLRAALDRKDLRALEQALAALGRGNDAVAPFASLLRAAGPADAAMAALERMPLPASAAAERARLAEVVRLIRIALPALTLTVDAVEVRGFEYESGVSFTLFARGAPVEIGRGGRYLAAGVEPSTGFSLYMDAILRALPPAAPPRRVYLPQGTAPEVARRLRAEGWVTVAGLEPAADAAEEARRLNCAHRWSGKDVVAA